MPYCPNPDCNYLKSIGKPAEYKHDVCKCVDCGTELILKEPCFDVKVTQESLTEEDLEEAVVVDDLPTAEMLKNLLHEHGIDSVLEGGTRHSPWGYSGNKIRIKVPSSRVSNAITLIREVLEEEIEGIECSECGLAVGEEEKVCPGCGERLS